MLEKKKLDVSHIGKIASLRLIERSGMLSVPENIQKLILRTVYFPNPSRETEILVHLYLRHATSPETEIPLPEDGMLRKLIAQGQVASSRGKFYLTEEGITVAESALELYPELENLNKL